MTDPSQPDPEPAPESGTEIALKAFARPRQNVRRVLDDGHLASYRHPSEQPGLVMALITVVAIVAAACVLAWAAGLAIVGVLCLTAVITRLTAAQHLAGAAEVTPTQFARLYPMVAELRRRFAMPRTRVFVAQSPMINAVSYGFQEPYVIVLNSALVDALDEQELKSVVGHEMGHIKYGHTRLGVLLGGVDARGLALPFPINLVAGVRDVIFLWWQRSTEMSADRVGIVACGRPSKAISAQVKLSVGPTLHQHVNLEDLAKQAADLQTGMGRVEGFLSQLGASHPFLVNRIQAMLDFVIDVQPIASPREAGVPEPANVARLVTRSNTPGAAIDHAFDSGRLLAGRGSSADLRLRNRSVSRRHFEIGWDGAGYVIHDLGSSNGTFVNGLRVASARLHNGDVVRAGFVELVFKEGPGD
jgi:Zn-dependent protease with chaperone function